MTNPSVEPTIAAAATVDDDDDDNRSLEHIVDAASAWCASNGVLMGARDRTTRRPLGPGIYEPAPFSLHPTPFPRRAFDGAYAMARPFNHVAHRAASDYGGWLRDAVRTAAEGDADFTGRLLVLADEVIEMEAAGSSDGDDPDRRRRAQNVALGILRSDYMLHGSDMDNAVPLQVELNTIASSFGCLSTKVSRLHRHLDTLAHLCSGDGGEGRRGEGPAVGGGSGGNGDDLPPNGAADGIAAGLAAAVNEYVRQRDVAKMGKYGLCSPLPVVVMVVQPGETNSVDQRDLEFILLEKHQVRLVRRTLCDIAIHGRYGKDVGIFCGRELWLPDDIRGGGGSSGSSSSSSGEEEKMVAAAVVYYRAGYTPDDYKTDVEWKGRRLVEHSGAIKCPDIFYHLFGTKKVQQVLAEPGVLKRFCSTNDQAELLSSCFADLHALGEGDDSHAVSAAIENPGGYVLKPQREGGGNNLYGDDMVAALKRMSYKERGAYILMQRIMPPSFTGKLVRGGRIVYDGDCVCEIGVFGISLRRYGGGGSVNSKGGDEVLMDEVVGHILRAKNIKTDEGGVAAGYAFLSSPRLV